MLFCCYLINISKMNTSSDNEQGSQEVLLTSKTIYVSYYTNFVEKRNCVTLCKSYRNLLLNEWYWKTNIYLL